MTASNLGAQARRACVSLLGAAALLAAPAAAAARLQPCRLPGVEYEALCGQVQRPLDPARPQGTQIDVHYAVLPAIARNKQPDPVFFFAGGPGQSAIGLAGQVGGLLARLTTRRDLVLIDQRGTGRSAPLVCEPPDPTRPLQEQVDPARQREALTRCLARLQKLPHGDLRHYTTAIAMADVDAVRRALGAARINLVGGSYGTRATLEYQRQFPQHVRRLVLDGVAPPDMVLPVSISADGQAAFDALVAACEQAPACAARYPALHERWRLLLDSLPREVVVRHPVTAQEERFTLTRAMAAQLLRLPLYVPALASALPLAISEAELGRYGALFGLATAMWGARGDVGALAEGMHYAVVCAEDMPRLAASSDAPGPDLGEGFAQTYRDACALWPRGEVPEAFYRIPPAPAAALVLSGGIDPVTPPRHGARVAAALGAKARHAVVPQAGHGVMALGCMREAVFRFIDAATDAAALQVAADCAASMPRPPAFQPVQPVQQPEASR